MQLVQRRTLCRCTVGIIAGAKRKGPSMKPSERDDALEALIDASSLAAVVDSLSAIAGAKAEHVASAWQDASTAKAWDKASAILQTAATRVERLGI